MERIGFRLVYSVFHLVSDFKDRLLGLVEIYEQTKVHTMYKYRIHYGTRDLNGTKDTR